MASISGCIHGTHVASIAAGGTSAADIGVARGASLIAVQVFIEATAAAACGTATAPCALSFTTDQIKGLQRVYALRKTLKISSANMSLGGGQYAAACDSVSAALTTAMTNLRGAGIAVLAAAGNNGYNGSISSPGCISQAIAVGATTKQDLLASYSNHSSLVQLLAPGSDTAILNEAWMGFSGLAPGFWWVAGRDGCGCGQGGRMAAAAIDWSRWGQSWKTT